MKTPIRCMAIGLMLTLFLVVSAGAQGLYWESTTTGEGIDHRSQMYYMPKMFKAISGKDEFAIFRLDTQVLYTVYPSEKAYSEMSFEEVEKTMKGLGAQMDAAMEQMRKGMKDMPEEQRKQVEQMMGGMMKGKSEMMKAPAVVAKTGERRTISGYACIKHIMKQGSKEVATVWVTKGIKEFEKMRKDFEDFSRRLMALNPMTAGAAEGWDKINGFPMETDYGKGIKTVVTKVEKRSIPKNEFEIPAGYKRMKSKLKEMEEEEK